MNERPPLLVGFVLWIGYGIAIENWYLVVPNAVAFAVCSTTIAVALRFRVRPQAA